MLWDVKDRTVSVTLPEVTTQIHMEILTLENKISFDVTPFELASRCDPWDANFAPTPNSKLNMKRVMDTKCEKLGIGPILVPDVPRMDTPSPYIDLESNQAQRRWNPYPPGRAHLVTGPPRGNVFPDTRGHVHNMMYPQPYRWYANKHTPPPQAGDVNNNPPKEQLEEVVRRLTPPASPDPPPPGTVEVQPVSPVVTGDQQLPCYHVIPNDKTQDKGAGKTLPIALRKCDDPHHKGESIPKIVGKVMPIRRLPIKKRYMEPPRHIPLRRSQGENQNSGAINDPIVVRGTPSPQALMIDETG